MTIPRVELSGAVLAITFPKFITSELRTHHYPPATFFRADATIVLFCMYDELSSWQTFTQTCTHRKQSSLFYQHICYGGEAHNG